VLVDQDAHQGRQRRSRAVRLVGGVVFQPDFDPLIRFPDVAPAHDQGRMVKQAELGGVVVGVKGAAVVAVAEHQVAAQAARYSLFFAAPVAVGVDGHAGKALEGRHGSHEQGRFRPVFVGPRHVPFRDEERFFGQAAERVTDEQRVLFVGYGIVHEAAVIADIGIAVRVAELVVRLGGQVVDGIAPVVAAKRDAHAVHPQIVMHGGVVGLLQRDIKRA